MAYLSGRLPTLQLATAAVAGFADALNRYRAATGRAELPPVLVPERIAASFASDRLMRIDGAPISGFAELSGFFATTDGWLRTHANYPHHRQRLLAVVGLDAADRAAFAARVATLSAAEVEDRAAAAGAIAVRVRTETEWAAHPAGIAAASGPLLTTTVRSDKTVRGSAVGTVERPLAGLRVLDLTRVIAGPIATRALALAGAEVLRVDPPQLPEISWQHTDTGQGKRSTLLDLRDGSAARRCHELLASADVLISGYRPGALERFGIRPERGVVWGRVDAWGDTGPWAQRRGFDSIVQAASGIALIENADPPGALPAQALDHSTGYLLAAAVVDALTAKLADGFGRDVHAALARTAAALLAMPGRVENSAPATLPGAGSVVAHGGIVTARPALANYADYPFPARPWGADSPAWRE